MMAKLNEADVTKQIRDVLKCCGVFHWKQWQGPMSQPKGVSDILGISRGKPLAIEIKKEGWMPPKTGTKLYAHYMNQKAFIDKYNSEGGIGFFATSADEVVNRLGLQVVLYPLFNQNTEGKEDG